MADEQYALLWSRSQNALHIEELARTVATGRAMLEADRGNDYIIVDIGPIETIDAAASRLRPLLVERESVRAA